MKPAIAKPNTNSREYAGLILQIWNESRAIATASVLKDRRLDKDSKDKIQEKIKVTVSRAVRDSRSKA